jgi:hypothetical protein
MDDTMSFVSWYPRKIILRGCMQTTSALLFCSLFLSFGLLFQFLAVSSVKILTLSIAFLLTPVSTSNEATLHPPGSRQSIELVTDLQQLLLQNAWPGP